MPCAELEDRLIDYADLDGDEQRAIDVHVAACAACRAYLDTLARLDAALTAKFAGRRVSAQFRPAVRAAARRQVLEKRPSFIPEVLDFIGWAAVLLIAVGLLQQLRPV
jgi:anti-sigma factor RsiW